MNRWLVESGIPQRTLCVSCCRADELAVAGKTGEEIAAELEVSPATL